MNKKPILAGFAVVALALITFALRGTKIDIGENAAADFIKGRNSTSGTDTRSKLVITNSAPHSIGKAAIQANRQTGDSLHALRTKVIRTDDLLKLRNDLLNSAEFDPKDRAYYVAAIDEACYAAAIQEGWIKPDPALYVLQPPRTPELGKGNENDPRLAQRQFAIAKLQSTDLRKACTGYKSHPLSRQEVIDSWRRSAAQGDARSAAMLSDLKLREKQVPIGDIQGAPMPLNMQSNQLTSPPDPSAEHIRLLQAALSTGDPSALLTLGPTLMQTYENGRFYFGEDRETVTRNLRDSLWPMLACSFGSDCGPENSTLLRACARNGQCDIPDLETYYRSYILSPEEVTQYDRLKPQLLDSIRTGNWSAIQFISPRPTGGAPNYIQPIRVPTVLGRG